MPCRAVQGTEKTEETLNIFLEYVPGGSIASLLGRFGESPCLEQTQAAF